MINFINRIYVVENKILSDSFYRSVRKLMTYREYSDYDEFLDISIDDINEANIADLIIKQAKQYLYTMLNDKN